MADTVSDFVLQRLRAWGVKRVFGYPGDGINGLLSALDKESGEIEFVQARHEELAAFMACAHAKFTGELGVCIATSGPGAIHLLNGLYDAKADHVPVLAIVGQSARTAIGGDYQQEVDLHSLSGIGRVGRAMVPAQQDLQAAAEILNAGSKVAILAGAGALHATDELLQAADLLGAGIAKALLGKAAVPDDLPFVTGSLGLLGTQPSWEMMEGCDTLLMVGTSFPYSEFLPKEGSARAVQIDIDPRKVALRYPTEVNLVGDSRATLQALLPMLARKDDRGWQQEIESNVARWWKVLEARAMNEADPINPQRFFRELSPRLPDECIVTVDSGTTAAWYARDLKFRRGMMGSVSGGLASMGCAIPYALAAKLAHPQRPVVALSGDGAMQMLGINALVTLAERWQHWADKRMVIVVLHNGDLNMVTWEQRASGAPRFDDSQLLPAFPFAEYARMLGLGGMRVDRPESIPLALEEAFDADRPIVLEVMADANVPALPPHITSQQKKAYAKALLQGDAEARKVVLATAKEWWAGVKERG